MKIFTGLNSSFVTGGPGGGIGDAPSLSLSHIISITFLATNFHQLIVEEDYNNILNYQKITKENKWNECQVEKSNFGLNIFWHLNSKLLISIFRCKL